MGKVALALFIMGIGDFVHVFRIMRKYTDETPPDLETFIQNTSLEDLYKVHSLGRRGWLSFQLGTIFSIL